MRFLLDMGISPETASFLRKHCHDAVHLYEQCLKRLSDSEIIEKGRNEGRTVLTHDLDFSRIIALTGASLPSVISFRLSDMRPESVNHYLTEALSRFSKQIEKGAIDSITEAQIR